MSNIFNTQSESKVMKSSNNHSSTSGQTAERYSKNSSFFDSIKGKVSELKSSGAILYNKATDSPQDASKINSFSRVFNQDSDQISGIRRVFKKSILLLSLSLISFILLAFSSLHLLTIPLGITLILMSLYISLSIIFFVIVADRSYVWLSILAHAFALLLTASFVGQFTSIITWVLMLMIMILYYFAYTELEKSQLASRLFNISQISSEATKLLITISLLTVSMGIFGSIKNVGTVEFVKQEVLENKVLFDELVMGNNRSVSLNRLLIKDNALYGLNNTEYTLRDFLIANYKGGKNIVSNDEAIDLRLDCEVTRTSTECGNVVGEEVNKRLITHLGEDYTSLNFGLDQVLDEESYKPVVKQFYLNQLTQFTQSSSTSEGLDSLVGDIPTNYLIDKNNVIPATVALTIFILGTLARFAITWISLLITIIIWKILKIAKFVRIDIETVESEVVSI